MTIDLRWRALSLALFATTALAACGDDGGGGGGSSSDACNGITCNTPPEAECLDGATLVVYETNGNCIGGECNYGARTISCGDQGGVCSTDGGAAECTGTDPCFGIDCNNPPSPTCEGAVAINYNDAGSCTGGLCDYPEERTDCAAEGLICSGGRCIDDVDPCEGVACDDPPDDECNADGELVAYESVGTCESGACSYTQTVAACPDGDVCFDGACIADPCDGLTCDTPPTPVCNDDGQVVSYAALGTCAPDADDPTLALCTYEETAEACEGDLLCFDGVCVEDTGACADVTCTEPPAADCNDDGEVVTYSEVGECNPETGDCLYAPTALACEDGFICDAGECVEFVDLCVDVVCDAAPGPECNEDGELVTYAEGVCNPLSGVCDYADTAEPCPDGFECNVDTCEEIPDPCEDFVCDPAPEASCNEDGDAVTYAEGVCALNDADEPECSYEETVTPCTDGAFCDAGACIPAPGPGDLIVTEYLNNAEGEDDDREWFEVLNTTDGPLYIGGLVVRDLDDVEQEIFTVDADIIIEAGAYFVFAETETSTDAVGFAWNPVASDWTLSNGNDEIELALPGAEGEEDVIVDTVAYDDDEGWPDASGRSISLDPAFLTADGNDDPENWCFGIDTYLDLFDDLGSPGLANEACDFACFDVFCPQPVNTCVDDDTVLEYSGDGVCNADDSTCDFSAVTTEVDCEAGLTCVGGDCLDTSGAPGAGDLVITEFMQNPNTISDDDGEWFEIYNPGTDTFDLSNLIIADEGGQARIPVGVSIEPGQYLTVARTESPGFTPDTTWSPSSWNLGNGSDSIILRTADDATEITRIDYDDDAAWPDGNGESGQLVPGEELTGGSNDPADWCLTPNDTFFAYDGDENNHGTPGAANACTLP